MGSCYRCLRFPDVQVVIRAREKTSLFVTPCFAIQVCWRDSRRSESSIQRLFFSFHRRINEIRRRNASPQIQRYEFFFIFKMNLPLIFPLAFIPYSLFCQYKFSVIFFSLVVAGRKKLKYHWNHLNFAVGFLFHPENFFLSDPVTNKKKKKIRVNPPSVWYLCGIIFSCRWESNYGHTVGLVERLTALPPLRRPCVNKT